MRQGKLAAKNFILTSTARGIDIFTNILLLAIIARYLGVSEFGRFSFYLTFVWTALPFLIMGLPRVLIKEISCDKSKAGALIGKSLSLVGFVSVPALAIPFLYLLLPGADKQTFTVIICIVLIILSITVTRIVNSVFIAFEKMLYEVVISIMTSVLSIMFAAGIIFYGLDLASFFVGLFASYAGGALSSLFLLLFAFKVRPSSGTDFKGMIELVRETVVLAFSQFLMQLYLFSGVYMLKLFSTNADIGLFQAPYRIISRLQIIPLSAIVSLFPLFSRLAENDVQMLKTVQSAISKSLFLISIPMIIILFIFAEDIMVLIFGEKFAPAAMAMRLQVLGLGIFFLNTKFEALFVCLNRRKGLLMFTGAMLAASVVLNAIFIPEYGYMGASLASVISQAVPLLLAVYMLFDVTSRKMRVVIFTSVAVFMGACLLVFVSYESGRFVNLVVPVLLVLFVFITLQFSRQETSYLKRMLSRNPDARAQGPA